MNGQSARVTEKLTKGISRACRKGGIITCLFLFNVYISARRENDQTRRVRGMGRRRNRQPEQNSYCIDVTLS